MERKLQFLESLNTSGSDGVNYKVCAYEHMVRDESVAADLGWESTGEIEYRLADGSQVEVRRDGSMRVENSGVELKPLAREQAAS